MVEIRARAILWALLAVNAMLVCGYLLLQYFPVSSRALTRWFDLSAEASIAPWYNGAILLVAGLLALLRGLHLRSVARASHWQAYLLLAGGLVFLSADEVAQIHETLSGTMHRRVGVETGRLAKVQAWDIVTFLIYATAGLALFALLYRDVIALLREIRGRAALIAGGMTFVIGAVLIDQLHVRLPNFMRVAIEDGMELTGAVLMLYGLLLKVGTMTVSVVAADERAHAPAASSTAKAPQPHAAPAYDDDELPDLADA